MLSACKAPGEVSLYEDHRNYRWSPGRAGIRTRPDLSARSTRGLVRLCRLGLVEAGLTTQSFPSRTLDEVKRRQTDAPLVASIPLNY